jgi:hypothetical protein
VYSGVRKESLAYFIPGGISRPDRRFSFRDHGIARRGQTPVPKSIGTERPLLLFAVEALTFTPSMTEDFEVSSCSTTKKRKPSEISGALNPGVISLDKMSGVRVKRGEYDKKGFNRRSIYFPL